MLHKCHITIFYEIHEDRKPTEVLMQLASLFKALGYNSGAIEEPSNISLEQLFNRYSDAVNAYKKAIYVYERICKTQPFEKKCVSIASAVIPQHIFWNMTAEEKHQKILTNMILMKASLESAQDFLTAFKENDIEIYPIDINSQNKKLRNIHMKKQLLELSYTGKVVFVVGAGHTEIGELLRSDNCTTDEYFIRGMNDTYIIDNQDFSVNTLPSPITIIDTNANPLVNATSLIEKDLLMGLCPNYLAASSS